MSGFAGNKNCPCVRDLDTEFPIHPSELTEELYQKLGDMYRADISKYGSGCRAHDISTPMCSDIDCSMIFPQPPSCDKSWCKRPWCFVDPTNCDLLNRRSDVFSKSGRFYSYATCGGMDFFTKENRIAALEGRVLNVGLNTNTGGWLGTYSTEKEHFKGPISRWYGPVVEFVKEAAYEGKFTINITEPPDFLRNKSDAFFNGTSKFDFCIYATSLGYLDMCVAQYTITDIRASTTDFMIMDSRGIFLIVQEGAQGEQKAWKQMMVSVGVIFQPFSRGTWIFMLCFVIPTFAILFVYHEYGRRGSTFPNEDKVVVRNEDNTYDLKVVPVPVYQALMMSVYHVLLSASQVAWSQPVVTTGGKINLLGMSFFYLTILASYTANLAALLTTKTPHASISGLDEAIAGGYRFCCERKTMESILTALPQLDSSMFVVDPPELGGDGKAGFNCANCNSRERVFDMVDPSKVMGNSSYCHAAISPQEDLEVLQADGKHCRLTIVGKPVQFTLIGFPIFEGVSPSLLSFFLRLKNEGLMDKATTAGRPVSKCPVDLGGEGSPLSISQLSGIWLVSFTFAFLGFISTCLINHQGTTDQKKQVLLHKRDQNGEISETLNMDDDSTLLNYSKKQVITKRAAFTAKQRLIVRSTELFPEFSDPTCGSGCRQDEARNYQNIGTMETGKNDLESINDSCSKDAGLFKFEEKQLSMHRLEI